MERAQTNLAARLEKYLPPGLAGFLRQAGETAASRRQVLYLVGGAVRDLLLGESNFDLDIVVEGDAIELAKNLAGRGKIVTHPRFGTARIYRQQWSIDFATARSETYSRPGALPIVRPGSIREDLFRRDFTVNAMAIYLGPDHYGELLDPYGGEHDLKHKLIRILHDKSFIDDATRIWRGLRYEQRLNFELESQTLQLLKRDIPMLDTISADRIRYELECILRERYPEKVFRRAAELGVLPRLHPDLTGNGWLAEKFEQARRLSAPDSPPMGLYLGLIVYRLDKEQTEGLISRLNFSRTVARTLQDITDLKDKLGPLAEPHITPSAVYNLLQGYTPVAITAVMIASDLSLVNERIRLFLDKLRYVKSFLTGDDLKRMGISSGPEIGRVLRQLHEARLDGKTATRQDEERLVRELTQPSQ